MNELVFNKNNVVLTTSRNIARDFRKRHDAVLRDIDNVMVGLPKSVETQDMFIESTYVHEQNNQVYREYLMNRDGFTLLAMGFTGKKVFNGGVVI